MICNISKPVKQKQVVLGMNTVYSIILSAAIALFYTVIGGLYSVAYTGLEFENKN